MQRQSAPQRGRQPQHAAEEAASASAAFRMSSSDSSGVRTWGPQHGGYNLDSLSDASDWSPSPRPSSSRSPAFEQPRYGPSSRQPYGRGNQHSSSVGRPKSGGTSRDPEYRDGQPAVERELFRGLASHKRRRSVQKESSSASRTIVKQRGIANQRPGERRSANQRTTEDKVQAGVTQTVVKHQGSAKQRPKKRRSTDQYPNVEERSPEIHATPVPAG